MLQTKRNLSNNTQRLFSTELIELFQPSPAKRFSNPDGRIEQIGWLALLFNIAVFLFLIFITVSSFASDVEVSSIGFLMSIARAMHDFGGLSTIAKVSAVITILISSLKVSALREYWDKLGFLKVIAPSVLGLVLGVLQSKDTGVSSAELVVYLLTGGGSVFLHEILNAIKAVPVLGEKYKSAIAFVEGIFR